MFDWLFPTWTPAWAIAGVVALRLLANLGLLAAVRVAGDAAESVAVAALAFCSTVLTVAVFRGTLGRTASHVEFVVQLSLLAVATVVVRRGAGERTLAVAGRPVATVRSLTLVAGVVALALVVLSIPLYGEATVAP